MLVRDRFRGKSLVNALIDLPFALPTIVAGLTLILLYGPRSPVGIDLAYQRAGVVMALLFVTLPFVVRTVQPVIHELDREMGDAAASLGAGQLTVFRRIVLPILLPAILSGVALAFARALGEFGSAVLISGNLPFKTDGASVYVFGPIQSGGRGGVGQPANEFVMGFVGPVNRVGGAFIRPHDIELSLEPNGRTKEALVERLVHLGFEVRVELVRADGEHLSAQVTREQAEALEPGRARSSSSGLCGRPCSRRDRAGNPKGDRSLPDAVSALMEKSTQTVIESVCAQRTSPAFKEQCWYARAGRRVARARRGRRRGTPFPPFERRRSRSDNSDIPNAAGGLGGVSAPEAKRSIHAPRFPRPSPRLGRSRCAPLSVPRPRVRVARQLLDPRRQLPARQIGERHGLQNPPKVRADAIQTSRSRSAEPAYSTSSGVAPGRLRSALRRRESPRPG